MKATLITFLFIGSTFFASAQTINLGDSLKIDFLPIDKSISDSSRLYCGVVYENISERLISVYRKLYPGDFKDRFSNVVVTLEKKVDGQYLEKQTAFFDRNPNLLYADSLRHYDLPKSKLASLSRDTLHLSLSRLGIGFGMGNYRVKIALRVRTIPDTTEYHDDPTGATAPPEDEIQYISSDWIYFKISNRIQIYR
jgi:hypothetical protein